YHGRKRGLQQDYGRKNRKNTRTTRTPRLLAWNPSSQSTKGSLQTEKTDGIMKKQRIPDLSQSPTRGQNKPMVKGAVTPAKLTVFWKTRNGSLSEGGRAAGLKEWRNAGLEESCTSQETPRERGAPEVENVSLQEWPRCKMKSPHGREKCSGLIGQKLFNHWETMKQIADGKSFG
ncbi:hypothetical protein DSO57_1012526, partial [Entomophthora muscae]